MTSNPSKKRTHDDSLGELGELTQMQRGAVNMAKTEINKTVRQNRETAAKIVEDFMPVVSKAKRRLAKIGALLQDVRFDSIDRDEVPNTIRAVTAQSVFGPTAGECADARNREAIRRNHRGYIYELRDLLTAYTPNAAGVYYVDDYIFGTRQEILTLIETEDADKAILRDEVEASARRLRVQKYLGRDTGAFVNSEPQAELEASLDCAKALASEVLNELVGIKTMVERSPSDTRTDE